MMDSTLWRLWLDDGGRDVWSVNVDCAALASNICPVMRYCSAECAGALSTQVLDVKSHALSDEDGVRFGAH